MQTNYSIEISAQDEPLPASEQDIADLAAYTLRSLVVRAAQISVVFVSKLLMQELNKTYRFTMENTDVLSFVYTNDTDNRDIAGEIIISPSGIRKYDASAELSQEIRRCVVHGILHLYGMVHPEEEKSTMYRMQESVLGRYNKKGHNEIH